MSNEYWEMLDNHPEYVSCLADLVSWSHNCDFPTPFNLFLDLIGYSEERFGHNFCAKIPTLGFLELSKLAHALDEYATRPQDVDVWLEKLMVEGAK